MMWVQVTRRTFESARSVFFCYLFVASVFLSIEPRRGNQARVLYEYLMAAKYSTSTYYAVRILTDLTTTVGVRHIC